VTAFQLVLYPRRLRADGRQHSLQNREHVVGDRDIEPFLPYPVLSVRVLPTPPDQWWLDISS
jgi:hypothetical protein